MNGHRRRRVNRYRPQKAGDSIEAHEQILGSALEDTTTRLKAVQNKLNKYKAATSRVNLSIKATEWLTQRREIDCEQERLAKQCKVHREKLLKGLREDEERIEITSSEEKNKLCTQFQELKKQHPLSRCNVQSMRRHLSALTSAIEQKARTITKEMEVIEQITKHPREQSHPQLPLELVHAVHNLRREFHLVLNEEYIQGMGSDLDQDIDLLMSVITTNFSDYKERKMPMNTNKCASAKRKSVMDMGLKDIHQFRIDTIENLSQTVLQTLREEISLEQTYNLELLRFVQRQVEERQRQELERKEMREREEMECANSKTSSYLIAKKNQVRQYLKTKEDAEYLAQVAHLIRKNDEEAARLERVPINRDK